MTPQIDLDAIKGNNFNFLLSYYDENDAAISATFEKIEFKVFKTVPPLDNLVLYAGLTGVTYYLILSMMFGFKTNLKMRVQFCRRSPSSKRLFFG